MLEQARYALGVKNTETSLPEKVNKHSTGVVVDNDYQTKIYRMMAEGNQSESGLMDKWFTDQRRSALKMLNDFDKTHLKR